MLANRKRAWSASVCGWSAPTVGGSLRRGERPLVDVAPDRASPGRAGTTIAVERLWAIDWSGSLSNDDRRRRRRGPPASRRRRRRCRPRAPPRPAAASGNVVIGDLLVEPLGGARDRVSAGRPARARRRRPWRGVVAEQEGRHDERADDDQRREQHAEDEPAAAAALEDLAPRDEPDAAPAGHQATSPAAAVGCDRLHEQLGQLRAARRRTSGPRRRAGPREQAVEVDRAVDQQLDPLVRALEDRHVAAAVEPRAVRQPTTSTSRCWRPDAALSASIAPEATIRPRAMITTSSQTSSTRSS